MPSTNRRFRANSSACVRRSSAPWNACATCASAPRRTRDRRRPRSSTCRSRSSRMPTCAGARGGRGPPGISSAERAFDVVMLEWREHFARSTHAMMRERVGDLVDVHIRRRALDPSWTHPRLRSGGAAEGIERDPGHARPHAEHHAAARSRLHRGDRDRCGHPDVARRDPCALARDSGGHGAARRVDASRERREGDPRRDGRRARGAAIRGRTQGRGRARASRAERGRGAGAPCRRGSDHRGWRPDPAARQCRPPGGSPPAPRRAAQRASV